jgi:hypothetical protein
MRARACVYRSPVSANYSHNGISTGIFAHFLLASRGAVRSTDDISIRWRPLDGCSDCRRRDRLGHVSSRNGHKTVELSANCHHRAEAADDMLPTIPSSPSPRTISRRRPRFRPPACGTRTAKRPLAGSLLVGRRRSSISSRQSSGFPCFGAAFRRQPPSRGNLTEVLTKSAGVPRSEQVRFAFEERGM